MPSRRARGELGGITAAVCAQVNSVAFIVTSKRSIEEYQHDLASGGSNILLMYDSDVDVCSPATKQLELMIRANLGCSDETFLRLHANRYPS